MTSDNIPWGESALVPDTSLSQQEGYMQAERLHPMPQWIFPETVATPSNTGHKAVLCERYARTRNCPYGTSCKFFHHPSFFIPPHRRTKGGRPVWLCYPYIRGLCRRKYCIDIHPEDPASFIRHTPCHSGSRCMRRELCPFYHPGISSLPLAPQPDFGHPVMNKGIADPLALGSDAWISRENKNCVSIDEFLSSKLLPSLEGYATRGAGGHLFKGSSQRHRHPPASIQPLSNVHAPLSLLQSCMTDEFESEASESPLVESLSATSVSSSSSSSVFQFSDAQSHPLKDLVDELPPVPFVRSPISDSQRKVGRSVTYDDLLASAKDEDTLCRRRMMSWSGFEPSGMNEERFPLSALGTGWVFSSSSWWGGLAGC